VIYSLVRIGANPADEKNPIQFALAQAMPRSLRFNLSQRLSTVAV
jgi:hypothetical protein